MKKKRQIKIQLNKNTLLIKFLKNEGFMNMFTWYCLNDYMKIRIKECISSFIISKRTIRKFIEEDFIFIISLKNKEIENKNIDEVFLRLIEKTNYEADNLEGLIEELLSN